MTLEQSGSWPSNVDTPRPGSDERGSAVHNLTQSHTISIDLRNISDTHRRLTPVGVAAVGGHHHCRGKNAPRQQQQPLHTVRKMVAKSLRASTNGHQEVKKPMVGGSGKKQTRPSEVPLWAQGVLLLVILASSVICVWFGNTIAGPVSGVEGNVPKYLEIAFPLFFVMMGTELALLKYVDLTSEAAHYALADSWSSVSAGAESLILKKIIPLIIRRHTPALTCHMQLGIAYMRGWVDGGACFTWDPAAYVFVFNNSKAYHLPFLQESETYLGYDKPLVFLFALLSVDFSYYWFHRWAHTNAIMWAGHSTHHSSEYFNLSTALRQSWWQALSSFWVYLYLAVLGLPPHMFMAHKVSWGASMVRDLNNAIEDKSSRRRNQGDTKKKKKKKKKRKRKKKKNEIQWIFEFVLSTPSHHRVHHDRRVHKNFGGILIIWDRIFGSFLPENVATPLEKQHQEEACVFGVSRSLGTWSQAILQNWYWRSIIRRGINAKSFFQAIRAVTVGPGFYTVVMPRPIRAPASSRDRIRLKSEMGSSWGYWYMVLQTLTSIVVGLCALVVPMTAFGNILLSTVALGSFYIYSMVFDAHPRAYYYEAGRTLILLGLFYGVSSFFSGVTGIPVTMSKSFGTFYLVSTLAVLLRGYDLRFLFISRVFCHHSNV
eukprot:jgi/Bigna1/85312/estExt_fgenesh1_pg.C_30222